MNSQPEENKKRVKKTRAKRRVYLDDVSESKVSKICRYMEDAHPGVRISSKDLINFIVTDLAEKPDSSLERRLREKFFDEERALRNAIEKIQEAKNKGLDVDLSELLKKEGLSLNTKKNRITKAKRSKQDALDSCKGAVIDAALSKR